MPHRLMIPYRLGAPGIRCPVVLEMNTKIAIQSYSVAIGATRLPSLKAQSAEIYGAGEVSFAPMPFFLNLVPQFCKLFCERLRLDYSHNGLEEGDIDAKCLKQVQLVMHKYWAASPIYAEWVWVENQCVERVAGIDPFGYPLARIA